MTFRTKLLAAAALLLGGCASDTVGSEAGEGTIRFLGRYVPFITELRDGEPVHQVRVDSSPDRPLSAALFASEGDTVWGVKDDALAHWDLASESLLEEVPLPTDAEYADLFVADDAVWLAGGHGTVWVTKVTKRPLEVAATLKIEGKWFNGAHATQNGLDVLVSNHAELLRIDPASVTVSKRVDLNPKAGIADMVVVGDQYWIALRGQWAEIRFARLSVADLSMLEASTEPAPWPGHEGSYGYQSPMANAHAIYAPRVMYADGRVTGCIVRVPLRDPSLVHDLYCVDPELETAHFEDFLVDDDSVWVLDDGYGGFARVDATTGDVLARIDEFPAEGFFR